MDNIQAKLLHDREIGLRIIEPLNHDESLSSSIAL